MTTRTLTCEEFEHGLGDHLDGSASAAARASMDAHAAACPECAALLSGVASIVAEARSLPELAPSRDLWRGIEARIAAPVIALDAAPRRHAGAERRPSSWAWMGVAAAALVVVTAGVTYTATRAMVDRASAPAGVATTSAPAPRPDSVAPVGGTRGDRVAPPSAVAARGASAGGRASGAVPRAGALARAAGAPPPTPAPPASSGAVAGQATFDAEIGRLRTVLERRRTELDPTTVAILEHNLDVIDQAIDQSRAALARDPANQFLTEQLNSTLGKKVELLRTAAMLPARL